MKEVEYELLNDVLVLRSQAGALTSPGDLFLITEAAATKSITILRAAGGEKIGYVVWGMINKHSTLNIINNGMMPRYFYEFAEGKICLILNVFTSPGRSREASRQLKVFIRAHRALAYIKKHKAVFLRRKKNAFYKSIKKHFDVPSAVKSV